MRRLMTVNLAHHDIHAQQNYELMPSWPTVVRSNDHVLPSDGNYAAKLTLLARDEMWKWSTSGDSVTVAHIVDSGLQVAGRVERTRNYRADYCLDLLCPRTC
jgi:hypothetical protein